MQQESLSLQHLTRRIADTPQDFLRPPRLEGAASSGALVVAALVHDVLVMHGADGSEFVADAFRYAAGAENLASITALLCWLLADPELIATRTCTIAALQQQLQQVPQELAPYCSARALVEDADRREELARLTLARLGLRPAGETLAQAQDRLSTISSAERARVIAASRAAEQRAREVREALARKAAEESADKWGRE
jgi:hypothetical protein